MEMEMQAQVQAREQIATGGRPRGPRGPGRPRLPAGEVRQRRRDRDREERQTRRRLGICVRCGTEDARPERVLCAACSEYMRRRDIERQEARADPAWPRCSYPGCERPRRSAGLCGGHHTQQLRGRGLRPIPPGKRGRTPRTSRAEAAT